MIIRSHIFLLSHAVPGLGYFAQSCFVQAFIPSRGNWLELEVSRVHAVLTWRKHCFQASVAFAGTIGWNLWCFRVMLVGHAASILSKVSRAWICVIFSSVTATTSRCSFMFQQPVGTSDARESSGHCCNDYMGCNSTQGLQKRRPCYGFSCSLANLHTWI